MPKLHIGTIGWSYNFWKPAFYPPETSAKNFLTYYSSKFNSLEVDSTFYRIPTQQAVINWRKQTPNDFLFSFKFPQLITHVKRLRNAWAETEAFLKQIQLLEEKLGVLLLQFPPNFDVRHMAELEVYLEELPRNYRYAIEVRNAGWLKDEFYGLLRRNRVGLVWAEGSPMLPLSEVTADYLYIRWEGDRSKVKGTMGKIEIDRKADLKAWADKLKPLLDRGIEVFGYFGKYYSGYPPSDVENLRCLIKYH